MSEANASLADRARENATGIVSTLVTGIWLAALFTGQDWWLAAMLFGYVVVVPVVAMLFGDEEEDEAEGDRRGGWTDGLDPTTWGDDRTSDERDESAESPTPGEPGASDAEERRDALDVLRERYARGELTDEQFERKLDRLLETESLEDLEDRRRERGEAEGTESSKRAGSNTTRERGEAEPESERER